MAYPEGKFVTYAIGIAGGIRMLVAVTNVFPLDRAMTRRWLAFETLATAAHALGMDVFVCEPQPLRQNRALHGWEWVSTEQEGTWRQTSLVPPPETVFYDAMYLGAGTVPKYSLTRLRRSAQQRHQPWFNPQLPAKDELFRWLLEEPMTGGTVPQTGVALTPEVIQDHLDSGKVIWLKPAVGSGGMNMLRIQPAGSHYRLLGERMRQGPIDMEVTTPQLQDILHSVTANRRYFLQENVDLLETADGRKADFRVTLVRNQTGAWETVAITVRQSAPGSYLTNYHAGGSIHSLSGPQGQLVRQEIGLSTEDVDSIDAFAHSAASRLEAKFSQLGVLGLDVGRSAAGKLYIYDCNTRPGRDILTTEELVHFMRSVAGFASHLHHSRWSV